MTEAERAEHKFPCDNPCHPRCHRAKMGNWTCEAGHVLRRDGLCEACDAVPFTVAQVLRALLAAGCAPKRTRG